MMVRPVEREQQIAVLKQVLEHLGGGEAPYFDEFGRLFRSARLDKGACFARAGVQADGVAFVVAGIARMFYCRDDGREFNKGFVSAPDFMSVLELLITGEPSYPCSSYQFRRLIPALADRWMLVAPDFPGFGYSATPPGFDGHARFLERFVEAPRLDRVVIYLHDYGSQIGLRLALARSERVFAIIIQNGDLDEDQFRSKYDAYAAMGRPRPQTHFDRAAPHPRLPLESAYWVDGVQWQMNAP